MKIIKDVWNDIRSGKNLDVFATFIISIIISVFGIIGIASQNIIASAILATLALVSFNILLSRRDNAEIRESIIQNSITTRGLAKRFFTREFDRSLLRKNLSTSRKAFFWGLTFATSLPLNQYTIEQGLESRLEVRFLLLKRNGHAVEMTEFQNGDKNATQINLDLTYSAQILKILSDKKSSGKIEVREVDYLPPYTIIATDYHLPTGKMYVRLMSFRTPNETRPTFELDALKDNDWYKFFCQQFELVWDTAKPVNL
jgi:hypothetical protein